MTDRRQARQFEPPPWEREQFEQLAARRAAEAEQAAVVASTDEVLVADEAVAETAVEPVDATAPKQEAGAPSDEAVAAMLAQLAAEEPKTDERLWKVGTAFAALLAVLGSVMVVWGMAAFMSTGRSGGVGVTGGISMVSLGGLFVGAGLWVVIGNLRKRGVI